jgi:hypothetical protein
MLSLRNVNEVLSCRSKSVARSDGVKHKIPVEMGIAWMPPFNRTCATLCLMICICSAQSMSSGSRARLLEVEEPKVAKLVVGRSSGQRTCRYPLVPLADPSLTCQWNLNSLFRPCP